MQNRCKREGIYSLLRALTHAEILDASLPNDAATTSGSTAVLDAREPLGTRTGAGDHRTLAANDGRRVPR